MNSQPKNTDKRDRQRPSKIEAQVPGETGEIIKNFSKH
jgi:hypothetical protein